MTIESWVYRTFSEVIPYNSGSDLRVNCPFCKNRFGSEDAGHHLHISMARPTSHCFRCDYAASWHTLYQDITGEPPGNDFRDDLNTMFIPLYQMRRLQRKLDYNVEPTEEVLEMPDTFMTIQQGLYKGITGLPRRYAQQAKEYIKRRLKKAWNEYLDQWGIWTDPIQGYGTIVFPVEGGWWQQRNILSNYSGPKYMSCSFPKGNRLYNYKALQENERVFICEGIISAASLGKDAVALCGKKATPEQLYRLKMAPVETYYISLDSDAPGNAKELALELERAGKNVVLRQYLQGDPNDNGNFQDTELNGFETRVTQALS